MAEAVYICCALIGTACTMLLLRSFLQSRARMLLWVTLAFGFLTLNTIFTCVDLIFLPDVELWGGLVRNSLLALSGGVLTAGLIWEMT